MLCRISLIVSAALIAGAAEAASNSGYTIENFPILERLQAQGATLDPETVHWMEKWKGMNLEEEKYTFKGLGGATSITMKVRKQDPSNPQETKSMGAFVPRNGAGNPNTGIAYFNMAAILGYDGIFRPSVRYEAGPRAMAALKSLIQHSVIKGRDRLENEARILKAIAAGAPLEGYMKTGKTDGAVAVDALGNPSAHPNGAPRPGHPIIAALQASNPTPKAGATLVLAKGFAGDALELSREYSVIMTLDAVFQQWDRYSGGNTYVRKDQTGQAHFYAVDNDGSDIATSPSWTERNLSWFSRYDRKTIEKLQELYGFLENPARGFLGYNNAETFIVDLGLYFELPPATYVARVKRNLGLLLDRVQEIEAKYGAAAFLDSVHAEDRTTAPEPHGRCYSDQLR
jgi:hypothetical protein